LRNVGSPWVRLVAGIPSILIFRMVQGRRVEEEGEQGREYFFHDCPPRVSKRKKFWKVPC